MNPKTITTKECRVCEEVITNPICPDCLEKQMVSWTSDYDESLVGDIKMSTTVFIKTRCTDVNCIICNSLMEVCPHCYSKEVLRGIYRKNQDLAQKFVRVFNYDLV